MKSIRTLVKEASVHTSGIPKNAASMSALAQSIENGSFGKEAQYAFEGTLAAVYQNVKEDLTDKTASAQQIDYNIYDENAARRARLDNLLRK